jgi:hypothetical protein
MTETSTENAAAADPAPPPRRRRKTRTSPSRTPWTPSRRWLPLPRGAVFLGASATALRKHIERAARDERGRVHLPGDVIAEKRGRLWFLGFPS